MTEQKTSPPPDQEVPLPPMPEPGAGPDEWRRYHGALFMAGKLGPPQGQGEPDVKARANRM